MTEASSPARSDSLDARGQTTAGDAHPAAGQKTFPAPPTPAERLRLRAAIRAYAARKTLIPPLSLPELVAHARAVAAEAGAGLAYAEWLMVAINNEAWRDTVAAVPFERRILLLPQCLRTKGKCPAKLDELGIVCEACGSCPIGGIQSAAEELGYLVLIAEGTTVVTKLIQGGKADAVVGVSCLSVLERAFPHMTTDAVPGIAIPLNRDGCDATEVDVDWVMEAVRLRTDRPWEGRIDVDALKAQVRSWFTAGELDAVLGPDVSETGRIARSWLAASGKRWRPILTACVYRALDGSVGELPGVLKQVAAAVECFHKASLIHDDIEDGDLQRDGVATLHREHGVPIALNTGDLLLGEGYRLIGSAPLPPERRVEMLSVAAEGHLALCLGQGEELCWMRRPGPLSAEDALRIFRLKTSPAFEVALRLGALAQGADGEIGRILSRYSQALGTAYQIRDDLSDYNSRAPENDVRARRPSLLLALAYEALEGEARQRLAAAWRLDGTEDEREARIRQAVTASGAETRARDLLGHYGNETRQALAPLRNVRLKSVLAQIAGRILGG